MRYSKVYFKAKPTKKSGIKTKGIAIFWKTKNTML